MADEIVSSQEQVLSSVMSAFQELARSAEAMEHDRYFSFFDRQDFTALNADGSVLHTFHDFEIMFRNQISFVDRYLDLKFDNVKVSTVGPDVAILVNEYSARLLMKSGDTVLAEGAGTQVWSRSSGKWLLVNVSGSVKPAN